MMAASEDGERTENVGTPEERQRIFLALKEWADHHPNPDTPLFVTAIDIGLTPEEIVDHVEDETAIGVAILDVLVLEAKNLRNISQASIGKFLGRQFPLANFDE